MKVIFFGTPDFVIPVLEAIKQDFNLVGVVTNPDQLQGRKQILAPSPVKNYIQSTIPNLPVLIPEKLNDSTIEQLKSLNLDLIVVAAYGKIIPQEILSLPKYGALNIHPSLLPKYRGASPIQEAILHGEKTSGITIIKMDQKMDHGSIIAQEEYVLTKTDTFASLAPKMFEKAAEILVDIIPQYIKGKIIPIEQDHSQATFTKLLKKEDGFFDINNPPSPKVLDRMIRAYFPWPTVWTIYNNKIVKFLPGKLVQMEGKKPVHLTDFLRGYPNFPIKSF